MLRQKNGQAMSDAILALPRFYLGAWRQGAGAGNVNGTQVHLSEIQVE